QIRIRVVFGVCNACAFTFSRIGVLYEEHLPLASNGTVPWYLVLASIQQDFFISYMVMLISILAIDRWIATRFWACYDSYNSFTVGEESELILSHTELFLIVRKCI
ncbi:hypothetical protein PFISCL1PPCAC_13218, partial [Pristionchus fissidentatus]